MKALDRLDQWGNRLYRLDPDRLERELPLRAQLLRRILVFVALGCGLYLILGAAGIVRSFVFPFDAFELLAAVIVCVWLSHRGKISSATTLLLVISSHPASFLTAQYGLDSPAAALLLLTILFCGLFGGYLLKTWVVVCCLLLAYIAAVEWVRTIGAGQKALVQALLFWWGASAATAWLVSLFARHLEGILELNHQAEQRRHMAVIEERTRIAREIHDTLAQGFTGIVVQLNAAEEMIGVDESKSRQHLDQARDLARASLNEARRSVWALRPESLDQSDLAQALEGIGRQATAGLKIPVEVRLSGAPRPLAAEAELNLLRICQEAVTNAVRHAQPQQIVISLSYEPRSLRLEVVDNGAGMSQDTLARRQGLGLTGMRERAQRLHGRLEIESETGKGTMVKATVPLD
jgi:signal transduction histidine kinase